MYASCIAVSTWCLSRQELQAREPQSRACKRSGKRSGAGRKSGGVERSVERELQKTMERERSAERERMDQVARHEHAGHEDAVHEIVRHEIAGHKIVTYFSSIVMLYNIECSTLCLVRTVLASFFAFVFNVVYIRTRTK